jgi:hypothetical protein
MGPGMLTIIYLLTAQYPTPLEQKTQPSYVPQSVAMSGANVIRDYVPGDPVPAGYHASKRLRTGLVATGFTLFGTSWFASAIAGALAIDNANAACAYGDPSCGSIGGWPLFLPVVGPLVMLGSNTSALGGLFLVFDAVLQAGSLAMAIVGLVVPKIVLVRNDVGGVTLDGAQLKF